MIAMVCVVRRHAAQFEVRQRAAAVHRVLERHNAAVFERLALDQHWHQRPTGRGRATGGRRGATRGRLLSQRDGAHRGKYQRRSTSH